MATHARQQYFADEHSLSKENREFSIADEIQQKIDGIEPGAQVNKIETVKVNGTALVPDANKAVNVEVPEVIDNLYTVDPDNALSAKQGKLLYDYIQNIASRGRFLSNWNSATGLPMTNPSESPYPYKSGDYFVVSNVAGSGGTNYRPDGSSYIIGQASTVAETEDVNISDFYFYDGTNWLLLVNTARQIAVDSSLSTTSTNPVENRVVTNALNNKQNILTAGNHIDITNNVISAEGFQEELTAGDNITIGDICTTESDMKGPCPSGFHVPLNSEWAALCGVLTNTFSMAANATTMGVYLKMPKAGYRAYWTDSVYEQDSRGYYWSSSRANSGYASYLGFLSTILIPQTNNYRAYGYSVRCFKNSPVVPDSSWTVLYQGAGSAGIFYDATEGLISVSGDGTTWYTIMDKNLGATTVYNDGDTLSEANCGKYYQRGNNYGFPRTGSVMTSSTQVDASGYGPGNYYNSNTFIITNLNPWDWSSVQNDNLRGGQTQGTFQDCIYNVISAEDTKYSAGTGINIDANNVISATATPGQTYTAGNGINISQNNEISADTSVVATKTDLNTKQDTLTAGKNTSIENICESDMQGPCPSGFHVPTVNEWNGLINIMKNALSLQYGHQWMQYLHIPYAGQRDCESSNVDRQRIEGFYATSIFDDATPGFSGAYYLLVRMGDTVYVEEYGLPVAMGFSVRGFKNEYIMPTSSWTVVQGTLGSAGIFRDQTNGLISITDGTTGYTIMDKNLGATTVYNSGDTLSEANCGKYYQWGNNYGFPRSGSITTSSTQVDASGYGPGNYYSSNTFITTSTSPFDWSSVDNKNLRGGVSQGTWCRLTISAEDTKYSAGTGINIDANNVISATATPGQTYTAGNGIDIDANNEISVDTTVVATQTDLSSKQDTLAASTGINIDSSNNISNTLPGPTIAATAPTGTEGALWYDTTNDVLMAHDGTAWKEAGTQMKVLSYGHSTWQDFIDAYNENAIVYCRASSNSNPGSGAQGRMAFMAFVSLNSSTGVPQNVEFQYYRSRSDHNTAANQLDQVFVYTLTPASGGTWTVTERNTGAKAVAGTGINLTFGSGNMTISADTTTLATQTDLNSKQDTLVSGTNIKTINNESLLGSGNITISAPTYTAGDNITIDQNNEISAIDTTYTAGPGIEIRNGNDYSALKGPCSDGYHVPTLSEFSDLVSKFLSFGLSRGTFYTYYKVPMAGLAGGDSGYSIRDTGTQAQLVLATAYSDDRTYYAYVTTDYVAANYKLYKGYYGYSLRPFKDVPVAPDSNWTVLYQGTGNAGIYYNATEGLISLSTDGTNWITVADKNLGATTVFNTGDTLSEANCGKFYQWGNNYGFPGVGSDTSGVVTSSTKVDASSYGPSEYSSSTFIITGADWSSVTNNNLWGGTTGVVTFHNAITNIGVTSVNGQTGDVTLPAAEIGLSSETGNVLTAGAKIWTGDETDMPATPNSNTLYFCY